MVEPMGDDDDDGAGCQDCDSSVGAGSAPVGLLVLVLGAVLIRRRRD